jgi:hypothetical protein
LDEEAVAADRFPKMTAPVVHDEEDVSQTA